MAMMSATQESNRVNPGDKPVRPLRFVDTQASVFLDLLRGLAALLVLGDHWRNMLFVDYRDTTAHRGLLLVPYSLTAAAHQAVMIFFVLSGYLIGGSVLRSLGNGTWSWGSYMTHRLVRLWLVLLPGLLLGLFWDELGMWLNRAPLLYGGIGINHITLPVGPAISPGIFLGNVFFLEGWRVPLLGSNGALWSLPMEFWYYVVFPLGLLAVLRRYAIAMRCLYAAGVAALIWLLGRPMVFYLPVWLLGFVLVMLPAPHFRGGWRWAACALYLPLVFFCGVYHGTGAPYTDYPLGVATFVFLWVLLSARLPAEPGATWVRLSRGLSRFSFTLYVVHVPFLLFLTGLGPHNARWIPNAKHVGAALCILAVTLAYAYTVAWATEFRTDTVRRWIERRLGLAKRPFPSPHNAVLES